MFHAESTLAGYTYKIGGGYGDLTFCTDEWWAVMGENFIRTEHGLNIRIGYGIRYKLSQEFYPYGCVKVMYVNRDFNKLLYGNNDRIINTLAFRKKYRK